MPDISKCGGYECPIKESCYRFNSPSSDRQAYFSVRPGNWAEPIGWVCEYYWPIKEFEDDLK